MKIEFKNGSTIENIETDYDKIQRNTMQWLIEDMKLKWYQVFYITIYVKIIKLFTKLGFIVRRIK